MTLESRLKDGLDKAFLSSLKEADPSFTPNFLINDWKQGEKVFCALEQALKTCTAFCFSVAFITESGVQLFKPVLKELEKRGIKGRILTSDYLCFSQPKALDVLASFSNIELKMVLTDQDNIGFHTKGYLFHHDKTITLITGSSNMTQSALLKNEEWNTRLISSKHGEIALAIEERFNHLFYAENTYDWKLVHEEYSRKFELARAQKEHALKQTPFSPKSYSLVPNSMQVRFIDNLKKLIDQKQDKALLISATGTGKTYAAAFAVRELKPKRILFLVHREQIARQAMESFQTVIGPSVTYGLLGGGFHQVDAQYLFSTVQTLSKKDVLHSFAPDAFDMIILDEVHRAAAASYRRIFDWFAPKFWLGMSATPSRTDGQSIFELFDYHVACEIGLKQALEADLLCPFHYYALSDLVVQDESHPDAFNDLENEEQVRHLMEQMRFYGWSGKRVKGLIFVSSIEQANALSSRLNEKGLRTLALSGKDSIPAREAAIERLVQKENTESALDYLITVDIFNEGVDIPEINQVVLLRPTQSAIVFIQQLGRGLRKTKHKEYLVVLDFIGVWKENFLIPVALSETRSGNKSTLREFVSDGTRTLPGASTVYFDEVSRKRIYDSIDQAKLDCWKSLKDGYLIVEDRLDRIPRLVDFELQSGMDPLLIFSSGRYPSYPEFLKRLYKDDKNRTEKYEYHLSETELEFLRFISREWARSKRPLEFWMLQAIKDHPEDWKEAFLTLAEENGIHVSNQSLKSLEHQFARKWQRGTGSNTWDKAVVLEEKEGRYIPTNAFLEALKNPEFVDQLDQIIELGLYRWQHRYKDLPRDGWLILNEPYSYEDSFKMMDFNESIIKTNVGGYVYNKDLNIFPVYINYDKAGDIAESIAYEDHFLSPDSLHAFSKNNRRLNSPDIIRLKEFASNGLRIPLFVRKNTKDGLKEFYYLGEMKPDGFFEEKTMKNGSPAVEIGYRLDHPVRPDLYAFLTQTL